jgi:hypothetical protein
MGGAAYPERGADSALTDRDLEGAHHKSRGLAPGLAEAQGRTPLDEGILVNHV